MDERINTSIDLLVMMVVGELAEDFHENEDIVLVKFLHSTTGKLLYDKSSKLWWCGPSDIAEMYKKEIANKESVK